ncbi:hypothetical protein EDD11_003895 [Mortierella claussenii]|nr:hypothetical protein EDD11_003895 [Mortierella claussenii]
MLQQAFLHSSRNKVLEGLVRHGHLVQELKATGMTDQELAVIGVLCPNLRVLELVGGRYTADNLSDLFQKRQSSIQVVRFRSCVQLKDIFQPLRHLSNLRVFELYGSFVGNTITSPYFFERDLFPVLGSCLQLRAILIEQVYIIDQEISQGGVGEGDWDGGGGGSEYGGIMPQDHDQHSIVSSSLPIPAIASSLSLSSGLSSSAVPSSMLSAQLGSLSSVRNPATPRPHFTSSLKALTLDCGDIPDSVILSLLSRCPLLEQLTLDWSRNLSDASLLSLPRICLNLTEISLARCVELTQDGFKTLFKGFPNLISININGNVLSDSILEDLPQSCKFLQHLSINSCHNVTDLGVQAILLNCAHLKSFSLRFVPGLSYLLFDDIVTPSTPNNSNTPGMLSTSPPRFSPESVPAPGDRRPWGCQSTLDSLHLSDLVVQPSNTVLEKQRQQQAWWSLHSSGDALGSPTPLTGDQLIQSRLRQLSKLEHLTIGGHGLGVLSALDGLKNPRELKTLRITRMKQTMTIKDTQWLVEQAAPNLTRLVFPVFGNRSVIEWLEDRRPGLLLVVEK